MNEKVKAVVVTGFKKIELRELNKPKLGKKDLLMKIIQSGKFPLKKMITQIYPLEDVNQAYKLITKKKIM